MGIAIKNGHIVDPENNLDGVADLFIENRLIAAVGTPLGSFRAETEIDAAGKYVLPGLVDLLARLREPGEEHKATIGSETKAAAAGGITQMVCPPDTHPIIDTPAMAYMMRDRAVSAGYSSVHPLGALTRGLQGKRLTDMAMLMDAGCVGVSNALASVENTLVIRRAMQYASTYDITVFMTPMDHWLYGNGVVHEGRVSTWLGLPAVPEAAETVGVARDLALIETSGVRAHFDLISCARSVTMIEEARQRGLPITASVSINHLLHCEDNIGDFDTQYKVIPPLRTKADRQALIDGVKRGVICAICSDHQPLDADAKLAPFSEAAAGIAGFDTFLCTAFELADREKIPLPQLVRALSTNPATIIGKGGGSLTPGTIADVCIFDPDIDWIVGPDTVLSMGCNSPLSGRGLKGRVSATIIDGQVVHQVHQGSPE